MSRDLHNEREFAGGIDNTILQLNSLIFDGLPLFLSEEGDPNFDTNSGTPPYIVGVMLNRPECMAHLLKWAEQNRFAIVKDGFPTPNETTSTVSITSNPLNAVSIANWTKFKSMQLGEKYLQLSDEEAKVLTKILSKQYVAISIEDWEGKFKDLWPKLLKMFLNM